MVGALVDVLARNAKASKAFASFHVRLSSASSALPFCRSRCMAAKPVWWQTPSSRKFRFLSTNDIEDARKVLKCTLRPRTKQSEVADFHRGYMYVFINIWRVGNKY